MNKREYQPIYSDPVQEDLAIAHVRRRPEIVDAASVERLRSHMAVAGRGEAFIIQGGDCAETFADATRSHTKAKIGTLRQIACVIAESAGVTPVMIGRIAGQYAKPRTNDTETRGGVTFPSYRGDAVNSHVFTAQARTPDPQRLVRAAETAAETYRHITDLRAQGFFASACASQWNNAAFGSEEYERFCALVQAPASRTQREYAVEPFISHEALLLRYEEAFTRTAHTAPHGRVNTSAHMVWVGERTRGLDTAHVAYLASIDNPVGIKLGPAASADDVRGLLAHVNPDNIPGRLVFIPRFGAQLIGEKLPELMRVVADSGCPVTWVLDPMHGNSTVSCGRKVRYVADIEDEIRQFFAICARTGTVPGGLHIEFSEENVCEIIDGGMFDVAVRSTDESLVDPRLNPQQVLRIAFLTADLLTRG